MNGIANYFVDNAVQCWGCPVFDRLFQIVSNGAAAVYSQFSTICLIIFCVLFAFYVVNAVWKNMQSGGDDPFYQKSMRPVIINSIVALSLLGLGVALPRLITTVTFEPVAQMATVYTQTMIGTDSAAVNERVTYTPEKMSDNGFYRPQMRDMIIMLTKTTITQFQSYMKLGIAVMDKAFSWDALLGIGALIKHIILFLIGLYLFYGFFKIFAKFCFYFADIIVAMAFFAFFFPLSLVLMAFKGAQNVPGWMSGLGKNIGIGQFKNLIKAIITLAAAVITYTVIVVIIAKYFSAPGASAADLMQIITSGNIFAADLSDENLAAMTLMGAVVLIYVLNFIYSQIPEVTKMVLDVFGTSEKHNLGDALAKDAMQLTNAVINTAKNIGKTVMSSGNQKEEKTDGKKDNKAAK